MLKSKTSVLRSEIEENKNKLNKHIKESKEKMVSDSIKRRQIEEVGSYENYIKNIYGLSHGKGKKRKKK